MLGTLVDVVTGRLAKRVRDQFSEKEAATVIAVLEGLRLPFLEDNRRGTERVQAAIVRLADGNSMELLDWAALAERDWRDVLVAAGLADEDWPERLTALLGSE